MISKETIDEIQKQGSDAFLKGYDLTMSPYKRFSEKYFIWLRGWSNAKFAASLDE